MAERIRCSVCKDEPKLYRLYYQAPKDDGPGMTTKKAPFHYCEKCRTVFDDTKPTPASTRKTR